MKISKLVGLGLLSLSAVVMFSCFAPKVHAQAESVTASESWDSNCSGTVNGLDSSYLYYSSGDTINLTINNTSSSQTLALSVTGESHTDLSPGQHESFNLTLSSQIQLQAISTTCTGNGNGSNLYIEGASGSLGCSVSDGKVWNVIGQYNNVAPSLTMYRGGTYVAVISDNKGGPGYGDASIDEQFAGQSSATTYYLYDGSNSSAHLIGQATCPAIASSSSTTKKTTSPPVTTTGTTTTTTPPATTTTATPTTTAPASTADNLPTTLAVNSTAWHASLGFWLLLVPLFLLLILFYAGFWKAFVKAGRPGWAALIPLYNTWVVFELGGKPGWWTILMLVPLVNIIALVMFALAVIEVAKRFGKGSLFGFFALFLFGFVGWPILGFGKAQYKQLDSATPSDITQPSDSFEA